MQTLTPSATKQRGMAIISALLIAAVVAVIAAGMLSRQSVFTRALESEQSRVQGGAMLLGGLETSRQVLNDARRQDVATRLDQAWAQPIRSRVSAASAGGFEGRLEDQQGKFNLRNLRVNERIDIGQLRSFERLCAMIGIDPLLSQRISQRVIDAYPRLPTQTITQGQAALGVASGRETSPDSPPPALPATRPMLRSVEDLRGIDGMSERLLALLGRYVSVIPANTWVNGNTASPEVLAAVVPGLSLAQARAIVAERDRGQWFVNRGDVVNRLRLAHLTVDELDVGVVSEWFLLQGSAQHQQRSVRLQALLYRPQDEMPKVLWSRLGV